MFRCIVTRGNTEGVTPIPHVVVAMAVAGMAVVAAMMRADKKVVEVVVTTTTIIAAIEIRRSTRTLLAMSVTIFLLVMPAVTSLVVLMTARPMRTCAASSMAPNMAPPGLKQFTSHLRQVVWPRNFKFEKLRKYDGMTFS
jgi:hypothetical protein